MLEVLSVSQTLKEVIQEDAHLDVLENSREAGGQEAANDCRCAASQS